MRYNRRYWLKWLDTIASNRYFYPRNIADNMSRLGTVNNSL